MILHVDVELAVQMVDLVTEGPGQQALAGDFKELAVAVLGADGDFIRPHHVALASGLAEAPFGARLLALGADDHGVDKLDEPVIVLHVDDHGPAQNAHLGSRQAHALGLVHGVRHVPQQQAQAQVELLHGMAGFAQGLIAEFEDFSNSHLFYISFTPARRD